MIEAVFATRLRSDGERHEWRVTCERCGEEICDSTLPAVSVFRVNMPPRGSGQFDEFLERWIAALRDARTTGRAVIVDREEVDVHKLDGFSLQEALVAHAEACPGNGR